MGSYKARVRSFKRECQRIDIQRNHCLDFVGSNFVGSNSSIYNRKSGFDNDVIYIWQLANTKCNGKNVYKIGITSYRLGNTRIEQVAIKIGCEAVNVVKYRVDGLATTLEGEILKKGSTVNLGSFGGFTEIRALTKTEYNKIIDKLNNANNTELVV